MLRSKILRAASLRNMRVSSPGGGGGGGSSLLLDTYTGATVAYSVRKLRTAYSGPALRVARLSDSAEQDIGFVTNDLDTSAITSFVGGSNGFVVTWYDQSGNGNNATVAISVAPIIVNAGTLVTLNSKAAISAATGKYLILGTEVAITAGQSGSYWMTYHRDSTAGAVLLTGPSDYMWYDDDASQYISNTRFINTGSAPYAAGTRYLHNCIMTYDSGATLYKNGSSIGSYSGSVGGNAGLTYLPSFNFRPSTLLMQEFVFWQSDQSSNRTGITSNINTYFTIY